MQSAPGALRLAAPGPRDLADLSPPDQQVVIDLDAIVRAVPDTS